MSSSSNKAAQDAAIHWISAPTSLLSFICSAAICYHVVQHKKRQTYQRLVLGLSFFDMLSSGTIFCARFGNIDAPGAPCTAVAFLQMWAVGSATWYNVFMSFMFLLIVNYNVKDEMIIKYLEPVAHLASSVSPIALSIAGHFLEVWNPVTFTPVCWVGKYPTFCEGDDCIRGGKWFFFYDHFVHALFYLGIFLMVVTNGLIFLHVRKTLRRNRKHERRASLRNLRESQDTRTRQVAIRSFMFCGGFCFTYMFSIVQSKVESPSVYGTWWYVTISILGGFFWPLQGFFDSLIYFHPRYRKWRKVQGDLSWLKALYKTVLTTETPHGGTSSHVAQRSAVSTTTELSSKRTSWRRMSSKMKPRLSLFAAASVVGNDGEPAEPSGDGALKVVDRQWAILDDEEQCSPRLEMLAPDHLDIVDDAFKDDKSCNDMEADCNGGVVG